MKLGAETRVLKLDLYAIYVTALALVVSYSELFFSHKSRIHYYSHETLLVVINELHCMYAASLRPKHTLSPSDKLLRQSMDYL